MKTTSLNWLLSHFRKQQKQTTISGLEGQDSRQDAQDTWNELTFGGLSRCKAHSSPSRQRRWHPSKCMMHAGPCMPYQQEGMLKIHTDRTLQVLPFCYHNDQKQARKRIFSPTEWAYQWRRKWYNCTDCAVQLPTFQGLHPQLVLNWEALGFYLKDLHELKK